VVLAIIRRFFRAVNHRAAFACVPPQKIPAGVHLRDEDCVKKGQKPLSYPKIGAIRSVKYS
jgi:hypothetical protein